MIKDIEILNTDVELWLLLTNGEVDIWEWGQIYITKRWNENGPDYWGFLSTDGVETRVKFISK